MDHLLPVIDANWQSRLLFSTALSP